MTSNTDNVVRFVPRPLEIVSLAQLVPHGRYVAPRHGSFWFASEEERADDGEGQDINWSLKPLPGNRWEVIKAIRTIRPGEEPETADESTGPLDLDALRSHLEAIGFPLGDELFDILKTRTA